jgi:hypothetical protein
MPGGTKVSEKFKGRKEKDWRETHRQYLDLLQHQRYLLLKERVAERNENAPSKVRLGEADVVAVVVNVDHRPNEGRTFFAVTFTKKVVEVAKGG